MPPVLTSHEAKLIYSLIAAAEDDGLLANSPFLLRWDALKQQSLKFRGEDGAALYGFISEIELAGLIKHSWMLDRWLIVKERVEKHPLKTIPSVTP